MYLLGWLSEACAARRDVRKRSRCAALGTRRLGYHRVMRITLLAAVATATAVLATPAPARAEIGIGLFVGEPLGLDLKIGLERRSALDIVIGVLSLRDNGREYSYGHLTYLVTPFVGRGRSVLVPLRLGIGAAMFGVVEGDLNIAARAPFEIALLFRSAPMEIYGEIALKLTFVREDENAALLDVDGGIGLRVYF